MSPFNEMDRMMDGFGMMPSMIKWHFTLLVMRDPFKNDPFFSNSGFDSMFNDMRKMMSSASMMDGPMMRYLIYCVILLASNRHLCLTMAAKDSL